MGYSVRRDTEDIFGPHNILAWADLDSTKDDEDIDARVTRQIQEAFDQINGRLLNCAYTIPFELVDSAYDPIIVTLSARLVGVLLYDSRKLIDTSEFDEVQNFRKMVKMTYADIHGGRVKLVTYKPLAANYMQAIPDETPVNRLFF